MAFSSPKRFVRATDRMLSAPTRSVPFAEVPSLKWAVAKPGASEIETRVLPYYIWSLHFSQSPQIYLYGLEK